jgi:MinD-like ATPase involved in chromosome partitioning or flagellar assembly
LSHPSRTATDEEFLSPVGADQTCQDTSDPPAALSAPRTVSRGIDLDELLAPQHIYTPPSGGLLGRLWGRVATKTQDREQTADGALADTYLLGLRDDVTAAFASVKGGAGKSAVCRSVADILTTRRFGPVVVLEADLDLGTIGESAPAIARGATLLDVWNDREKLTNSGKLQAYLTRFPSGAALLRAPTSVADIKLVTVEVLDGVLGLLKEHYPIVLIDASPGLGVHNPVVAWAYQVATHIVAVAPARRATVKQLELLRAYLHQAQPEKPVTAVLNQVPAGSRAMEAIVDAARQLANGRGLYEVPYDPLLDFQLDAADLEIARLGQSTRVALKELALTLADSWSRQAGRR